MRIRGLEMLVFRKILPTYLMDDPLVIEKLDVTAYPKKRSPENLKINFSRFQITDQLAIKYADSITTY